MQPDEWPAALDLMRQNMAQYHERYRLPWDPDWMARNYLDKQNYIIKRQGSAIGFLSIEQKPGTLYIHTLQLHSSVQNGRVGKYVLRWLLQLAARLQFPAIACRVFKDHPARHMYVKLGFVETAVHGVLVSLEASAQNEHLRLMGA